MHRLCCWAISCTRRRDAANCAIYGPVDLSMSLIKALHCYNGTCAGKSTIFDSWLQPHRSDNARWNVSQSQGICIRRAWKGGGGPFQTNTKVVGRNCQSSRITFLHCLLGWVGNGRRIPAGVWSDTWCTTAPRGKSQCPAGPHWTLAKARWEVKKKGL